MSTGIAGYRAHAVERRRNRTTVRATDSEWGQITTAARQAGLKPGAWVMRTAVQTARLRHAQTPDATAMLEQICVELEGLRKLAANIGANVNQIAARLNATGELAPQTTAVLGATQRVMERVDITVARVDERLQ